MKYIIGDIHANIRELQSLLRFLRLQAGDVLVFLGDYINKLPFTQETLDLLDSLRQTYECVFLKGNHEYVWDRYINGKELDRQSFLLQYGGKEALRQYGQEALCALENNDIETLQHTLRQYLCLLEKMKDWQIVEDYLALHAGIRADQYEMSPLVFREENYFLRPDRVCIDQKYLQRYILVAGHTFLGEEPTIEHGYINIDLGAGYGKYIGAFSVNERKIIRSDGKIFQA